MANNIYYDAKSAGFYLEGINNEIPSAAIKVSIEDYEILLAGQEAGKEINPNQNGYPTLTDPPVLSQEQQLLIATNNKILLMSKASDAIGPLQDAVDLGVSTAKEDKSLKSWKQYRVDLNRLDISAAPDIQWPQLPE